MRKPRAVVALAATTCAVAIPALAMPSAQWHPRPFEHNLTADPSVEDGEPSIAINPANPRNMIVIYLRNNDAFVPNVAKGQPKVPSSRDAEQHSQGCDYAVTFNAGRTWARH